MKTNWLNPVRLLPLGVAALVAVGAAEKGAVGPGRLALKPLTTRGAYEKDGKSFPLGLYADGNEMPAAHLQAGVEIARTIAPLDDAGKPDPAGGAILAVAVGHSNPRRYFDGFQKLLAEQQAKGAVNPRFRLMNLCSGGKLCQAWAAQLGGTAQPADARARRPGAAVKSVQVAFVLVTYHRASKGRTAGSEGDPMAMPFEKKMLAMKADLKTIVQGLVRTYPHLKMVFLGSDTWRAGGDLEPEVYEEGFAVKWLIADQLAGDPELAYKGPGRKAPWLAWGGYIWLPEAPRDLFVGDGVHPSDKGVARANAIWLEALLSNPAARGWFAAGPARTKEKP